MQAEQADISRIQNSLSALQTSVDGDPNDDPGREILPMSACIMIDDQWMDGITPDAYVSID